MSFVVLQYAELENLLADAAGSDAVRVYILEQMRLTPVNTLSQPQVPAPLNRQDVTVALCVRAITTHFRILSWYYPLACLRFYLPEPKEEDDEQASPAQVAYERAWEQARTLQTALVARLKQEGYPAHTDGLVEINVTNFLYGTTELVALPSTTFTKTEDAE
jgi:hypothetical protein